VTIEPAPLDLTQPALVSADAPSQDQGVARTEHLRASAISVNAAGVPRALIVGWLAIFAGVDWLLAKSDSFTSLGALSQISIIELIEIVVLARLFALRDAQARLTTAEALATLAGLAATVLVVARMPVVNAWIVATSLIAFYAFARFGRAPAQRPFVFAFALFFAQYAFGYGPFIWLHSLVGQLDAGAVRVLLTAAGYAVGGSGSVVVAPARDFAVDVNYGCSSSFVIARVVPAFLIVVLGLRGALRAGDFAYLAVLAAITVCINLVRLMPVALSRAGYAFWHDGLGASMLSALYAVLILAAAAAAMRLDRNAVRA